MSQAHGAGDRAMGVADRLHSVAIHLLRFVRREDAASGISAAQLSALSVIVHADPLALGELSAAEQVRPATMSRIVDVLERKGLAERRPDPRDRRVVRVGATPLGEKVLREGRSRRVGALAGVLDALPPAEVEDLAHAASILERALRTPRQPP
jgi:DNA-binding MarR family transcriptional regulator